MVTQAEHTANARWSTVICAPAYKGREKLAATLLQNTTMTADAIIAALRIAPSADASAPLAVQEQTHDPVIASFGPSVPGGIFDPTLMEAGRQSALMLLGKKE